MKNFGIVFGLEFRETLRSKSFIVISVMMAIAIIVAAGAGLLFSSVDMETSDFSTPDMLIGITPDQTGSASKPTVAVDDRTGAGLIDRLEKRLPMIEFQRSLLDESIIESAIAGGVDACVILTSDLSFEYYEKSSLYGTSLPDILSGTMEDLAREDAFAGLGVSPSDAREIMGTDAWYLRNQIGGYGMSKYFINTFITVLLFVMITLYGQMVAVRVTAEKSSRTVEVLATSVSPVELLCGKVAGVGAAALAQMAAFITLLSAVVGISAGRSPVLAGFISQLEISAGDIFLLIAYFLLGFTLIAFLYGGLGAMVSKQEDLSGLASLPMLLLMGGYLTALVGTSIGKPNLLLTAASYVPFWSPVVMFSRMSIEHVSAGEIIISLLILLATTAFAARLAARLYRRGMLRYGKAPKVKELIDAMKK